MPSKRTPPLNPATDTDGRRRLHVQYLSRSDIGYWDESYSELMLGEDGDPAAAGKICAPSGDRVRSARSAGNATGSMRKLPATRRRQRIDILGGGFDQERRQPFVRGTLVECMSSFAVLAKIRSANAADTLARFGKALKPIPKTLRKTHACDQSMKMSYHDALTLCPGEQVYFGDPHSLCQRGSNENTNGSLGQYLPRELTARLTIALSLNTRPRKCHDYRTPLQVYNDHLRLAGANHNAV